VFGHFRKNPDESPISVGQIHHVWGELHYLLVYRPTSDSFSQVLKPKPFHSEDLPATDFSRQQLGDVDVVINRVLSISSFGRRSEEEKELVRRARGFRAAQGPARLVDFLDVGICWMSMVDTQPGYD